MKEFVHLHVHSDFSFMDGISKIKDLVTECKTLGMESMAITDHGVLYGAKKFYDEAKTQGIKPIIGCEVYVSSGDMKERKKGYAHLVLLAKNNKGYNNLVKLTSIGFTEGYYYKPRIDKKTLSQYSDGLIALSGCCSGVISKPLLEKGEDEAIAEALEYKKIFGEDFYIELQDHSLDIEKNINPTLVIISELTNIPLVCTNDVHYTKKCDSYAHNAIVELKFNRTEADKHENVYATDEFYLKSAEEMHSLFKYKEEAIRNTLKIAEKCEVKLEAEEYILPKFDIPENLTAFEYMKSLALEGLSKKYNEITKEVRERFELEIGVINDMGFTEYFLIVWDIVKFARDKGIGVGPGRGSGVGSIVAYALGITNVDPIKYGLLFERFLNTERVSMPDFDIDFADNRRHEIVDYLRNKYGSDKISQIVTFSTLKAKSSLKKAGKFLNIDFKLVDSVSKMLPINITLEESYSSITDFRLKINSDVQLGRMYKLALQFEGVHVNSGIHAAGVVIADKDITNYVPLVRSKEDLSTQYDMNDIESFKLLKMDILGLKTVTVIQNTLDLVKKQCGADIDIEKIDMTDTKVFELLSNGDTDCVFQLESMGMKKFMCDLKPSSIENLIAGISLYRPGPIDSIDKYLRGKKGNANYIHEKLEPILKETYGCIVYQEQVMQIVRELAGYSLGRSDLVRRAISKKKDRIMEAERNNFIRGTDDIPGCINNGIDEVTAGKIFDELSTSAQYSFNKSHAAAYSILAYQTAWLKCYYKLELLTATLMSKTVNKEILDCINICRRCNIDIYKPDINLSAVTFDIRNEGIIYGISSIKGIGKQIATDIITERQNGNYTSLVDLVTRVPSLKKNQLKILIESGAFDGLNNFSRSVYLESVDVVYKLACIKKTSMSKKLDQELSILKEAEKKNQSISNDELLVREKNCLGVYLTGHPLDNYSTTILKHTRYDTNKLSDKHLKVDTYSIAGIVENLEIFTTKKGEQMATMDIVDTVGKLKVIIFPNFYELLAPKLKNEDKVIVKGKIEISEEMNTLIANDIIDLDTLTDNKIVTIKIMSENIKGTLAELIKKHKGNNEVILDYIYCNKKFLLQKDYFVSASKTFISDITALVGKDNFKVETK